MEGIDSEEKKPNHDGLIEATLLNPQKHERGIPFENAWRERWDKAPKKGYFQTNADDSPFSVFSSRGWKIHIAFKKGDERKVAQTLYKNGLYFKVESQVGTYFNGNVSSGATVYIGSNENMKVVAETIGRSLKDSLQSGAYVTVGDREISVGSGTDIEVAPKIMARFDVAKTPFGYSGGNGKYAEHGLPTWLGLGGLPILSKYEKEVSAVLDKWNTFSPSQKKIYHNHLFKRVLSESRDELVKDFGEEFVLGNNHST